MLFLFTCLVRILRHASDKLIVNKDCIVSGCHKGVNFSVTKMPALNFETRLANQQRLCKCLNAKIKRLTNWNIVI